MPIEYCVLWLYEHGTYQKKDVTLFFYKKKNVYFYHLLCLLICSRTQPHLIENPVSGKTKKERNAEFCEKMHSQQNFQVAFMRAQIYILYIDPSL